MHKLFLPFPLSIELFKYGHRKSQSVQHSPLRMWYLFCLWCGTKFEDRDDLQSNCPGDTRELHDE